MARVRLLFQFDSVCYRYSSYLHLRKITFAISEWAFSVCIDHRLLLTRLALALNERDLVKIGPVNHNVYFSNYKVGNKDLMMNGLVLEK